MSLYDLIFESDFRQRGRDRQSGIADQESLADIHRRKERAEGRPMPAPKEPPHAFLHRAFRFHSNRHADPDGYQGSESHLAQGQSNQGSDWGRQLRFGGRPRPRLGAMSDNGGRVTRHFLTRDGEDDKAAAKAFADHAKDAYPGIGLKRKGHRVHYWPEDISDERAAERKLTRTGQARRAAQKVIRVQRRRAKLGPNSAGD